MDDWIAAVAKGLGVPAPEDVDAILDVARVAAHNVARPAAPITTYLLGAAVAQGMDLGTARRTVDELAAGWPRED